MSDDKPTNLRVARFKKVDDPANHDPRVALEAAMEWLDAQEDGKPDHVIVILGRVTENGDGGTRFFQTGSFPYHGQIGMMWEAMHMVRESGQ